MDSGIDGWRHTGLRIAVLADGDLELPAAEVERIVIPLSGVFRVRHDETTTVLDGRESVFAGPTDVLYTGSGTPLTISGRGRVAVAEAPTSVRKPSRYVAREDVPVEVRGAGRDTRQVHNFGTPDALDAAASASSTPWAELAPASPCPHLLPLAGRCRRVRQLRQLLLAGRGYRHPGAGPYG